MEKINKHEDSLAFVVVVFFDILIVPNTIPTAIATDIIMKTIIINVTIIPREVHNVSFSTSVNLKEYFYIIDLIDCIIYLTEI